MSSTAPPTRAPPPVPIVPSLPSKYGTEPTILAGNEDLSTDPLKRPERGLGEQNRRDSERTRKDTAQPPLSGQALDSVLRRSVDGYKSSQKDGRQSPGPGDAWPLKPSVEPRHSLEKSSPRSSAEGRQSKRAAEGNRPPKGANGQIAGTYILNAPLHRPANPRSLSANSPNGKSSRFDPRGAETLKPNGEVLKPSDALKVTVPASTGPPDRAPPPVPAVTRQRRAHSASNTDAPTTLVGLDPPRSASSRLSSPPIYDSNLPAAPSSPQYSGTYRLQHRHTLQIPKPSTYRSSRELSWVGNNASEDAISSAVAPGFRRSSLNLVRRTTRSGYSDMNVENVPQDAEAARWAEKLQQKRMSRRRRKEEEEDERVMVGTKVDQNHVNWVTAYNMLTGIRFTVSRTNAKLDRDLTEADFEAKHKFSFDITGNELTPSAKYDFKFKDYAPWVFRHLRAQFHLDPADYLISLTSKYILSELGSPGKSGSFFYFSRDYKYIIKTIHHGEHKMLRKILRDYYQHVQDNPNTLISQFYGLHRVKMPYGRKIHFVVMNNLFPPHRDIHQTFDLKGSTAGREFDEKDLDKNPRATLKDLNWSRRRQHLLLGAQKKQLFVEQMKRDVALLQRLHIMDYSLLIGIHDVSKGNDENLRDKTLQVFEPGGDDDENGQRDGSAGLVRTPSKQEKQRRANDLRQAIKRERPVPMDQSTFQMPDNMLDAKKHFYFYSDDGGFRATHEDGTPDEEIYYLGIIDCLTHYGFVKRFENFVKGFGKGGPGISAVPPEPYGERFIKFVSSNTKSREEVARDNLAAQERQNLQDGEDPIVRQDVGSRQTSQDQVMARAELEAPCTEREDAKEAETPDRKLTTARSPSTDRAAGTAGTTLPVLEEVGESNSVRGHSAHSSRANLREGARATVGSPLPMSPPIGGRPPPTPPKDLPRDIAPTLPSPLFVDAPITLEPEVQ